MANNSERQTDGLKNSIKRSISAAIKTGDETLVLQARRIMSTYLRGTQDAKTLQAIPVLGLGITGLRR